MQKVDILIFIIVTVLMIIGAVFSYSLPTFLEMRDNLSQFHFVIRYVGISIVGFGIMIFLSRLDPDKWFNKIGWGIFIISSLLLFAMPFLPHFLAPTINGARRWINFGILKLAPVEFFKIGFIFFLSFSFTRKLGNKTLKEELIQLSYYFIFFSIFWFLIIAFQSDLGQVVVMFFILVLMLIVAGGRAQTFGVLSIVGLFIVIGAVLSKPYRLDRIKNWIDRVNEIFFPNPDIHNALANSGQIKESLNAIYHGGILGTGIGNGIFKLGFLSDVHTDFVLAGIAEESGILGIFLVILLMGALIYRIFKISFRNEKKEYQFFAFGIGTMIAIQFLLNGLGVTSVIPLKGLTVPFLSYGGSSLLALSIGIGMVLMISKKAKL